MPPLRMWWFGYDIEERFRVGIVPDEETKIRDYHNRELDRWKLLFALDSNGVWPEQLYIMFNAPFFWEKAACVNSIVTAE